jgi:hypothetical protein
MGGGNYSSRDWDDYSQKQGFAHKAPTQVINTTRAEKDFLPINFKNGRRESRDSVDNPESTAVIVAGDVTGSMGHLAGQLIKDGLATFATLMHDPKRKPLSDPHIMGMAVGDANGDMVPIQCTQFEADIRVIQQFEKLYVEGNGQGNGSEGYIIPWVVAAMMTDIDCFDKRGIKGVLFTYGDDGPTPSLTRDQAKTYLGLNLEEDMSATAALAMVSRKYDVYHMLVNGSHENYRMQQWQGLLGERAIPVTDHTKIPEIMVGILELTRGGKSKAAIAGSFSQVTAVAVSKAIDGLTVTGKSSKGGVVRL